MNKQEPLEKVIKGLESCQPLFTFEPVAVQPTQEEIEECYKGYGDPHALMESVEEMRRNPKILIPKALLDDTIALLKALLDDATDLKAKKPNEDWISRKRLRDEIQYYIEEAGWGDEANKVLGWCLEFIDNQEAVKWDG